MMRKKRELFRILAAPWAKAHAGGHLPDGQQGKFVKYRALIVLTVCLAVALTIYFSLARPPTIVLGKSTDFEAAAKMAADGVGVVSLVSKGTRGSPIFVLEEDHASLSGQIELAIVLVRLYDHYGLRDVVLEGYLKDGPVITTDWFVRAAQGLSVTARTDVAVHLLKEGEINQAEFMQLAYADLRLKPGEIKSEYIHEPSSALEAYLAKMYAQDPNDRLVHLLAELWRNPDLPIEKELSVAEAIVAVAKKKIHRAY
jgi:hypothetical protein